MWAGHGRLANEGYDSCCMNTLLDLGTSSWTFADWWGVFYPSGLSKDRALAYYATQFNSVEVNTSFYGLPAPTTVIQWLECVPEGFTLALKVPRQISHEQRLVNCRRESLVYLDVLRSLGSAAAPGFLQLPPDLTRQREGRTLAHYLDWLAVQLAGLKLAVEVRARDLMTPAFADFLVQRGMGLVVVDRVGSPDLYDIWVEQLPGASVPQFAFLRLMGDDRNSLPDNREIRRPQEAGLNRWAQRIADLLAAGIHVYAYVHNPYEGHSPASVRRLRERINRLYSLPEWSPDMADSEPGQLPLL
jgi:uncharacterized protein YecE (DUF72 family)